MQSRVPVKNGNKRLYPAKITCELQLCATATTTHECEISIKLGNELKFELVFFYLETHS